MSKNYTADGIEYTSAPSSALDGSSEYLISTDNGLHFCSPENCAEDIVTHWEQILAAMDKDIMEQVNKTTEADTDTDAGKVQYVAEYLSVSHDNMVIG